MTHQQTITPKPSPGVYWFSYSALCVLATAGGGFWLTALLHPSTLRTAGFWWIVLSLGGLLLVAVGMVAVFWESRNIVNRHTTGSAHILGPDRRFDRPHFPGSRTRRPHGRFRKQD